MSRPNDDPISECDVIEIKWNWKTAKNASYATIYSPNPTFGRILANILEFLF